MGFVPENLSSLLGFSGVRRDLSFVVSVVYCPFIHFIFTIVLSGLLRITLLITPLAPSNFP